MDLCENVCHAVEQCNDTDIGMDLRQICASGCKVQEGDTAVPTIPCESEFVELLGCAFDAAGGECPTEANEAALEQQCGSAGRAYSSCLQAVDDDDDNDPDPPVGMCTETGGCEGCPNACATCACEATGDQEATIACLMSDACTMP